MFHPHWLSASRSSQRELISRYVATLQSPSASTQESFQTTLGVAEPTDVAAVLRWGLRHMVLAKGTFGSASSSLATAEAWDWYVKFAEAECAAGFPADAYSSKLLPLLPQPHAALLKDLLDLLSSVAAHAQGNGMFNTKLAKDVAWWVVSSRKWDVSKNGTGGNRDEWADFYLAWDRASRILEHVMLAYLRCVLILSLHSQYCMLTIASRSILGIRHAILAVFPSASLSFTLLTHQRPHPLHHRTLTRLPQTLPSHSLPVRA